MQSNLLKKIGKITLLSSCILLFSPLTNAGLVTVSYSATIGFDPSGTVGVGGQNAEILINELFGSGIGGTGTATLTGTFTYDSNTSALNSNNSAAGYTNAITAASVTLNGLSVNADISEIALNASSSKVGYNTNPSTGFCTSVNTCLPAGESYTPTGNVVVIVNDTSFQAIENGNSINFFNRDAVALYIGETDSDNEFSPKLSTQSFGDVFVDGVELLFISDANRSLLNSVALPSSNGFVTSSEVETTLFSIYFSGGGLADDVVLDGQVTDFTVVPALVPVPAAVWFFGSALVALFGVRKKIS